ncbi:MAG: hypothetical protein HW403_671 [Dehalococcoidia bacterium]|nr:hypothetical protein [Dehalococcoidia bacterium]
MGKTFQVIEDGITYEFEEAEEGGYTVTVPDLPGCVSEGDTFEEAMAMIMDAMIGWLTVAKKHGDPFPEKYQVDLRAYDGKI